MPPDFLGRHCHGDLVMALQRPKGVKFRYRYYSAITSPVRLSWVSAGVSPPVAAGSAFSAPLSPTMLTPFSQQMVTAPRVAPVIGPTQ